MVSQPSQRLAHDHTELDKLLKQLQQALDDSDLEASHAKLDLFWARLAVHIRAEHLHLFPTVLRRLSGTVDQSVGPSLSQAQSAVIRLREDHDFFMNDSRRLQGRG
jgi:hemerythrin-like domain-containing protein